MLKNLFVHLIMVAVSAAIAVILVHAFDEWIHHNDARRQAKWETRQARRSHPSDSGPRYE